VTGAIPKEPKVMFKSHHAFPHVRAIGVPVERIESAIESQIRSVAARACMTGLFWGRVVVDGVVVEYRALTLADGTINVGTYYKARI
jgi:hypothetical protein